MFGYTGFATLTLGTLLIGSPAACLVFSLFALVGVAATWLYKELL